MTIHRICRIGGTEILNKYAEVVDSVNLHGGTGGAFEVSINGELVHSKLETKRYPELKDVTGAIQARLG